jgi:two-component system KDP operon response regulator KdpE
VHTGHRVDLAHEQTLRSRADGRPLDFLSSLDELRERITLHLSAEEPGDVLSLVRAEESQRPAAQVVDGAFAGRTVLVVDDDARNLFALSGMLELHGFHVLHAENGRKGIEMLLAHPDISLVLMDVMMPEMDGFEALHIIRETSSVPVIMLTVRDDETDKVKGLELGADDYVTKPFSPRELASRIKAVLRRIDMESTSPSSGSLVKIDDYLQIDFNHRLVIVDGNEVKLRPTEHRLLYHLVQNAGQVLTHEMILAKVWGYEYRDESQYVRLYITYLRQKIEPDPSQPNYILTERGVGYYFVNFKAGLS